MLANFFSILLDEDCSMETAQRDVLLGTITWWGFHALLIWMGAWHFLSRDITDGALFASDLFAGSLIGATLLSLLRLSVGRHLLRFVALIGMGFFLSFSSHAQVRGGEISKSIFFGGGSYYMDEEQATMLSRWLDSLPTAKQLFKTPSVFVNRIPDSKKPWTRS